MRKLDGMRLSLIFLVFFYQQRVEAIQGIGRLVLRQELFGDIQSVSGLPDLWEAQLLPLPGRTLYLFLQLQSLIELSLLLPPLIFHLLLHLSELLNADFDGLVPLILILGASGHEI